MKAGAWTSVGAVITAAASSACCWLPLVALGLGLGAGGVAAMLERFRWPLIVISAALIGLGFYLNYRPEAECAPDGSCPPQRPRLRRFNRAVLWISAILVIGFAVFPEFTAALTYGPRPALRAAFADSAAGALAVGGKTCAGCEIGDSTRAPGQVVRLSSDAADLRVAFNRDTGSVRIVALLSPT